MRVGILVGFWTVAAAAALAVFVALVRGGRPVSRALSGAVQGLAALLAVDVAGIFTGVSLSVNALTAGTCAVLGVPGVVTLLILKTIFRVG